MEWRGGADFKQLTNCAYYCCCCSSSFPCITEANKVPSIMLMDADLQTAVISAGQRQQQLNYLQQPPLSPFSPSLPSPLEAQKLSSMNRLNGRHFV